MGIINHSSKLYGAEISVQLTFGGIFGGSFSPQTYSPSVAAALDFEAMFTGGLNAQVGGAGRLNFRARFTGAIKPRMKLFLTQPPPILNEIGENAFSASHYASRLLVNNVETPFKSFEFLKPKGASGASLKIEMASAHLAQIPTDAVYKFQIGKKAGGVWTWHTLIENARLDSRSHALALYNDTLSFSTVSPLADKLELCPRRNLIFYDGSKTDTSSAAASGLTAKTSLQEDEPIYDQFGNRIPTLLRDVRPLTLYYLLNEAFVKGCGFASFQTNIPNFEVTRCDFSITNSYLEDAAGLIGVFEPVFFAVGNVLWILDKTQIIPESFEPRALAPSRFTRFERQTGATRKIDGFFLQYTESSLESNYYTERIVQTHEETGQFGDEDFTQTDTTSTWREWRNLEQPDVVLKSALVREVRETRRGARLSGRETEDHFFDGQGRRIETRKTIEALAPNLAGGGEPTLQTVREETQQIYYAPDPRNPRRSLQRRAVTQIRGLIAIDSENQYFDEDFRQDLMEAHKAGNLTEEMSSDFGAIKTVTETLQPLGNGQVAVKIVTVDHLRQTVTNSISEVKTGDATLQGATPKGKKMVVWRAGVSAAARTGARVEQLAVGELPMVFALPLAERKLARIEQSPHEARIEIMGFDESVERGVFFSVTGRNSANLGIYLTEGFSIIGEAYRIQTSIEATEIFAAHD